MITDLELAELYEIQKLFSQHRERYTKLYAKLLESKNTIYNDSYIINDIFDKKTSDNIFNELLKKINWTTMKHKTGIVPRLISIQYIRNEKNEIPLYRHPVDVHPPIEPMNNIVLHIKKTIEDKYGFYFNHVLVQLYRNGLDHIQQHSDKTLDIVKDSVIVNVSFGVTRKLTLKSKFCDILGNKDIININMTHGSMFVLGANTNRFYTHGIKPDKRPTMLKNLTKPDEIIYDDQRISLTFRNIGTFIKNNNTIYGVCYKQNTDTDTNIDSENEKNMLIAFGKENKCYQYSSEQIYCNGFNCFVQMNIDD
jgi:hypothetical protein